MPMFQAPPDPALPAALAPPKMFLGRPVNPDLNRLLMAECCAFLVLWSLVCAGLLHGIALFITHPVLILVVAAFALLISALYAAEKLSGETPAAALLSTRDLFVLCWVGTACMGFGQLARLTIPPPPRISEIKIVSGESGKRSVEIWVEGRVGDELLRIVDFGRNGRRVVGVIVRHRSAGSDALPMTYPTQEGELNVSKYRLRAQQIEIDTLEGVKPEER